MPGRLSLEEKFYIVAVFGDVPPYHRARLFRQSRVPANALVIEEGRRLLNYISSVAAPKPPGRPRGRPFETKGSGQLSRG